ncbi:MAG TPA: phosphoglucosamine mutase [Gemmatimonadales bacterium]|nr:phosphoglucosamine mutase [Gemmatimonadales bacterium]
MTDTLMVGVSGIRGIVGKDLTEETVARYARAFGTWARGSTQRPVVVVGRDARESGPAFERAVIDALVSVGCAVVQVGVVPTPTVQLAVEHHHAAGGIAITASHNPIEWNALKFIGPDGIFLDGADGKRVLSLAQQDDGKARTVGKGGGSVQRDPGAVERHLEAVLKLPAVDIAGIRERRFTVALDAVRGAGGPVMRALLERLGCRVPGINLETDGRFPRPPEPVPENLGELTGLVRRSGADVGIAVDPDVDRLAIVDEQGVPIGEDYTLAFAVRAVLGVGQSDSRTVGLKSAGLSDCPTVRPSVVCNLSTSLVVEDAARECGAEVVRTPVGEVHVARAILRLAAVIGGEGNGGVMYPALHAGRDAPVAAALLLTLLARTGTRVSGLVAAAPRYAIEKTKLERGTRNAERGMDAIYAALRGRFPDAMADTQDGLRLAWRDRWLHVRPSNTEPIIRLIAEAPARADAEQLIEEGRRLCAAS